MVNIHEQIARKTEASRRKKLATLQKKREERSFRGKVKKGLKKGFDVNRKVVKSAERTRKTVSKKLISFGAKKVVNKKIVRKGPRPTLDLRRRPEREVPVKQHGFKEEDIAFTNILNQ